MFRAPSGLYPVTDTISVFDRGFACVREPLISMG